MVSAWATTATVLDITGVEATEQQVAQAQAAIEVCSGRIWDDTERLRRRDLYWLGRAVAYQAAWAAGQPGLETRMDLTSQTQDGVSASLTADAIILAPMAARAINRCSWRKSRTIHVRSPFVDGRGIGVNPLLESTDDLQTWTPMPGAP
ncbi:hypothetical protein GCM10010193_70510 [Kitasatospora atroaurantiaca]|uniref:Uncharacterized protein n=1 Tax=Kitasatospora atroaurantiaca TaxID=285545 RepID=A0A561ENE0_9ACTN|nr:hypothetical protein [Kitasatospora atroaurantiaca]TWE17136.1 hypothetical protein FB465_2141 [Kitasatospora atroaurantiaca]